MENVSKEVSSVKLYTHCKRCGRKLKNQDAQVRGYGKICYMKVQKPVSKKLF